MMFLIASFVLSSNLYMSLALKEDGGVIGITYLGMLVQVLDVSHIDDVQQRSLVSDVDLPNLPCFGKI